MRLPKSLVHVGLIVAFFLGQLLIWNDRRVERSGKHTEKIIGSEKLA